MAFEFDKKLDQTFLNSLYADDIPYAKEVFEGFLAETRPEFDRIKTDFRDANLKGLRQKLHKVKPTFSFVGLTGLTHEAETLIAACDSATDVSMIDRQCSNLFGEIENSFILVEKELDRMKSYLS